MINILNSDIQERIADKIISICEESCIKLLKSKISDERYLRAKQACKYCGGVDVNTLKKWESKGLTPIIVGRVVVYDRVDIDSFMLKHKLLKH